MFSRLLKHEWRSNAGLLGLLSLAAGGIGILATVVLRILVNFSEDLMYTLGDWAVVVMSALGMFLFFSVVALSVYAIAVQVILMYRFYKNKYTDEGYLTFTLPVKTTHIFWSSFVNMLIWLAISLLVVVTVIFLAAFFGTARDGLVNWDILEGIKQILHILSLDDWKEIFRDTYTVPYLIIMAVTVLTAPFYALFVPMACITAGAVLAKKHKILASFGVYYALNFAVGIVTSVAAVVPSILMLGNGDMGGYYVTSSAIQLAVTLALTVGSYFFTIHVMKKKLNLP